MKKTIAISLFFVLLLGVLAGCAGTPVAGNNDTAAATTQNTQPSETQSAETEAAQSPVKTGLAIVASAGKSENAANASYDVTVVAVTVNDEGVIESCIIDSIGAKVEFDASGTVTSDLTADIPTKTELGDSYGMKAYAGSKYEWYEQAAALADYAKGKTVEELKNGAIDESGKAPEGSDLASTATIYLGGYVSAIEEAVNNAQHLGAQSGDELRLAVISGIDGSKSATAEKDGTAQLASDFVVVTVKDQVITSCYIDALQAKVNFDATGTITSDLTAPMQTKNQLGENYGMKAYGGAQFEWNEQAAAFAQYVTGKTADQVAGIAVADGKASDADLASSVTIGIGGFQALIAKVMK